MFGPFDGPDDLQAIEVAPGLRVSLVSSGVASAADQIALWPDDNDPQFLFVCDKETLNPAVQRVDLSRPANDNVTTIVTGLMSCDPVRRTAWGTIIVAEEAGATVASTNSSIQRTSARDDGANRLTHQIYVGKGAEERRQEVPAPDPHHRRGRLEGALSREMLSDPQDNQKDDQCEQQQNQQIDRRVLL